MPSVNITIKGANQMLARLQALGINMKAAKNNAVDTAMQQFSNVMKDNAQAGHPTGPNMITGMLVASITWQHVGDGVAEAGVINDPGYAIYVEYGHSQTPGRFIPAIGKRLVASEVQPYPYFRPTVTQMVDGGQLQQTVMSILSEGLS